MDPHSSAAYQSGYMVGAIIGALVVGVLCGLIPLKLGQSRNRAGLAWTGFGLCVVAGFLLGLIGAVPMAGVMSLVIVLVGPAKKKKKARPAGPNLGPRTPAPQAYDL